MSFQRFLPPSKAYAAPWSPTHGSYLSRKQLTLVNNSGQTFESGTTYKFTIDTQSLVASGSLLTTCDDLRVVYQPSDTTAIELKRNVEYASTSSGVTTCATSSATQVVFQLQANISNSATDANYYIYYDNPDATTYPAADALAAYNIGSKTATFVAPFNGTTSALAAGSGTPTTATGAIRYSGGKSAMSFDGSNDKVDAGNASSLQVGSGNWTIEVWVNTDTNPSYNTPIVEHGANGWSTKGWNMFIKTDGKVGVAFSNGTAGNTGTNWYSAQASSISVTDGNWHHVAWTVNRLGYSTIYIDGTSSGTPIAVSDTTDLTGSVSLKIGTDVNSNPGYFLNGIVEETRLSTVVRYTSNFTPSTTPFVRDEYTKLLLHFDENGDDPRNTGKAIDDSGNGNHGTITGAKYVGGLVGVDGSSSSSSSYTDPDVNTHVRCSQSTHQTTA